MAKVYTNQPENINYLSPVGFRFQIENLPNTNWFLTSANLPGISIGEISQPTPFMQAAFPGNDLTFEPLNVTFLVDEDLENWREMYNWLIGMGFPESYDQYKNRSQTTIPASAGDKDPDHKFLSDATLIILNSNMVPNYRISFKDLFPTNLSEVLFDSASADIEGIKATASFRYLNYTYEKV